MQKECRICLHHCSSLRENLNIGFAGHQRTAHQSLVTETAVAAIRGQKGGAVLVALTGTVHAVWGTQVHNNNNNNNNLSLCISLSL